MRTTLTLEPDVARLIEDEVHRVHKPFKEVVNEAIRRGLAPRPSRSGSPRYTVRPHAAELQPGIDPARLNGLADELEIAEARSPHRTRRARRA